MTLGYFAHWPVFTDLSRVNWLNHVNVFVFSHCFLFFKSLIHNKNILACCMRYNRTMDRCVFEHTNVQLNIIKRVYMFVNAFKVFNSSSSKRHFCWIFFSSRNDLLQNHHGLLGNTKDITAPPCAGNVFKRMLSSTQSKKILHKIK